MARLIRTLGPLIILTLLVGCRSREKNSGAEIAAPPTVLTTVQLQLDWFPEPAHGGFYQALALGYYAAAGLNVEIIPGGPGGHPTQKVASGQVPFSMGRSDDMMLAAQQGLPVLIVAALMQHDPQALLLHADHPVSDFTDLDGRAVMAYPGSAWIPYLQKRYNITFDLMPMSFGLSRFIADPELIQACFVTDEPFRLRQQGVAVKTLLLADSGYDPYRVVVAHRPFAEQYPEITQAFVTATLRGWTDYMHGDPSAAHALIAEANDHMTPSQMAYSHAEMTIQRFVEGDLTLGESIGHLDPTRLQEHADLLFELEVLTSPLQFDAYATTEFIVEKPD